MRLRQRTGMNNNERRRLQRALPVPVYRSKAGGALRTADRLASRTGVGAIAFFALDRPKPGAGNSTDCTGLPVSARAYSWPVFSEESLRS